MKETRSIIAALVGIVLLAFTGGNAHADVGPGDGATRHTQQVVEGAVGRRVQQVRLSASADMAGVSITAPSNPTYRTDRSMIAVVDHGQPSLISLGLPSGFAAQKALDGSLLQTRADGAAYLDTTTEVGIAPASSLVACSGGIDYPHISGSAGVTYTVNVHLDGSCRMYPSQHSISGSLFRHRWFGWEHLTTSAVSKPGAWKLRLSLNKKCKPGDWYKYRAVGRFYSLVGNTRWSVTYLNENRSEIKCVRTPGASS